jgi:hypothetical protein
MKPQTDNSKTPVEPVEAPKEEQRQPWKEWLKKDEEMIAHKTINMEDLDLIDQTYLLESAPSQGPRRGGGGASSTESDALRTLEHLRSLLIALMQLCYIESMVDTRHNTSISLE